MEKKSLRQHDEMQYARMRLMKNMLIDVEEAIHYEAWIRRKGRRRQVPSYLVKKPDKQPIIAYGLFIPQYGDAAAATSLSLLVDTKEGILATLYRNVEYRSTCIDYQIYAPLPLPDTKGYRPCARPCALLLNTSLNLTEQREYGFGFTLFSRLSGSIFDSMLQRRFLFCMRDIERAFQVQEQEQPILNWKSYINEAALQATAQELL